MRDQTTPETGATEDMLRKVRALLAKAERTDNEHERDAFLAAAQRLQAKYAIDATLLAQNDPGAKEGIDFIILCDERNTPLIKAKRELAGALANVFNGYSVMAHGRVHLKVFAHISDLQIIQVMYNSLLLQLQTAMARDERQAVGTLASWRVSYAHAYVRRLYARMMDQRNYAAQDAAGEAGVSTALVLVDRSALTKRYAEDFFAGGLRKKSIPTKTTNSDGYAAGRRAADQADLGGRRVAAQGTQREIGS